MSFDRVDTGIVQRLWIWLQNSSGIWRVLILLTVYVVVGVALEELADLLRSSWNVQPWDPAAGWHIVLLFGFGLRYLPVLPIAPFLGEVLFQPQGDSLINGTIYSILVPIIYGAASALLLYRLDIDPRLFRLRDVVRFAVVFAIASLFLAIFKLGFLLALSQIEPSEWFSQMMHEWAGEATGIALLAPPLLILLRRFPWLNKRLTLRGLPPDIHLKPPKFKDTKEWLALFTVTILFTWAAHGRGQPENLDYAYFTFVPLTFVCAWKGFESTTIITLLINIMAVSFVGKNANNNDALALQFGLMTITYIGLLLSAYVSARNRETTKRKNLEIRLRYDATHDSLTGLYNRAWFLEHVEKTQQQADERDYRFAILFLDLDRFKTVNDSLGHAAGDRLLVQIADRLQECLPESTLVARLGGDEFTIILEELTDISQASQIAGVICQRLGQTYIVDGYEVFTTVSIGVAFSSSGRQEVPNLLRNADIALYEAKTRGKSQYAVFDSQMYDKVMLQAQLEQDLRQAINELNR